MSIAVPAAGGPVLDTWGQSVADALNDHQFDYIGNRVPAMGAGYNVPASSSNSPINTGVLVPFAVAGGLVLEGYGAYITDTGSSRQLNLALYRDDGTAAWPKVTGSEATRTWTPGGLAAYSQFPLTGADVVLTPGYYWLAAVAPAANGVTFGADVAVVPGCNVTDAGTPGSIVLGATLDVSAGITTSLFARYFYLESACAGGGGSW